MTAEEALAVSWAATAEGFVFPADEMIQRLRRLGYVIIPITPSGETLERAAANFAKQDSGAAEFKDEPLAYQDYARQEVRRLYAAIVGGEE